jgi:ectoine hydroxylase-related dioxygenase (phytanoyl-CoA dioxygenase family)
MPIERLSRTTSPEEVAGVLARDGCVVVERVVDAAVLDRARTELEPYLDATPFGPDEFSGRRTRRTGGLVARSTTCRELIMYPLVLGAVRGVLGHATSVQLHLTQVIAIGPDEPGQQIHRDQWAFDFFPFPSGYEVQCNTIWAMTDFTEANGATRVIPGSNTLEDRREFAYEDTEPAEMPAGSVLFYGLALPRRRREPLRSRPLRAQHHLCGELAPPGGEPVPLVPGRDRARASG